MAGFGKWYNSSDFDYAQRKASSASAAWPPVLVDYFSRTGHVDADVRRTDPDSVLQKSNSSPLSPGESSSGVIRLRRWSEYTLYRIVLDRYQVRQEWTRIYLVCTSVLLLIYLLSPPFSTVSFSNLFISQKKSATGCNPGRLLCSTAMTCGFLSSYRGT